MIPAPDQENPARQDDAPAPDAPVPPVAPPVQMQGPVLTLETKDPTFGDLLLRYRMDAEMSLESASEKAHVAVNVIRALENDDIEGAGVHPHYCMANIERLCLAYGQTPENVEHLLELFGQQLQLLENRIGFQSTRSLSDCLEENNSSPMRRPSAVLISALIMLLLLLVAGGYIYKRLQQKNLQSQIQLDLPALLPTPALSPDPLPLP